MNRYNPLQIEQKWQKIWADTAAYKTEEKPDTPKMYLAEMFPYPSGAGLHVGHVRNFTIVDVLTRFFRQQGLNVLRPFGYDTFGLPAENYAIKTGTAPQEVTKQNIANFRKQAKRLGYAIDWSREINTGPSGASCNSTKKASPTKKSPTSGGAPKTKPSSPTRKSKMENVGAAATKSKKRR